MQSKKRFWNIGPYTWFTFEAALGFATMYTAFRLTPASVEQAGYTHVRSITASAIYAVALAITAHAFGLHNNTNLSRGWKILVMSAASVGIAVSLTTAISALVLYQQIGRIIIAICFSLSFGVAVSVRLLFKRHVFRTPHLVEVVGSEEFCLYVHSLAREGFQPVHVQDRGAESVNEVIVENGLRLSPHDREYCLKKADTGVQVSTIVAFAERNYQRIPCQFITPEWLFAIDFRHQHPFYHQIKRLLDIGMATCGLLLSAPILLFAMVAIRLESKGDVFYSQIRVGLCQKEFRIWKLRSMRIDSETNGPQWAAVGDPRVTRIGRFLRKSRIDEIPQFWNILCGDMAFVGPRPERPQLIEKLAASIPYYRQRHLVKPGLTGWAQICYPYGASEQETREKLSFDFYYIKNSSLMLDLQIMLQTVGAVAKGAR